MQRYSGRPLLTIATLASVALGVSLMLTRQTRVHAQPPSTPSRPAAIVAVSLDEILAGNDSPVHISAENQDSILWYSDTYKFKVIAREAEGLDCAGKCFLPPLPQQLGQLSTDCLLRSGSPAECRPHLQGSFSIGERQNHRFRRCCRSTAEPVGSAVRKTAEPLKAVNGERQRNYFPRPILSGFCEKMGRKQPQPLRLSTQRSVHKRNVTGHDLSA
jgi:hypothetical protein